MSPHSYAKHLCLLDLVTLVILKLAASFLLICNPWKSSGRDRGGVKLHCLLSAVNTANCAAAKRAGEPPLDPARAVKIHGRTGKWCNSNTVELKSTQWREVQSMYVSGVMILPEVTYAEEQKRKP